jgi:flagellar hook-length control protein FliK
MGIDITNLAPAGGAGAGCSCGLSSPASNPADVSFERLVELASDGPAAAEPNPSPGSIAGQPGPHDPAQRAAPNPAAQLATTACAAISWQQAPAEAGASRKPDSGGASPLDEDGATDEAHSAGSPEDPWAALLAATATAVNPAAEPPPLPSQEAVVDGPGTIGVGSLDEPAPGRTIGSGRPAARPPQLGDWFAVPDLDANAEAAEGDAKVGGSLAARLPQPGDRIAVPAFDANAEAAEADTKVRSNEAAEADPKVRGWAERVEQNLRAGAAQPMPVQTAAGLDPAASGDVLRPADRVARTPPSRADLPESLFRNTPGAASTDQGRTDGQLEAASRLAVRAMLERALATDNAQRSQAGEGPEVAAAAGDRPTVATAVASSAPGLVDLFQVPADEAVRRYADLLAAQAPTQRDLKVVDSPAPRGQKDTAAGDFARAFSFAALAADPAAIGAPASAEPAPAGAPVEANLTPQIVKAVSLLWRDGVGEARLRLEPERLGSVTVSLRVERGIVTARVTADMPAVRDWIRAHEADLRDSLASQGLELDRIVVSADPDERNRQSPPDSNSQPKAPRAPRGGPKFELNA